MFRKCTFALTALLGFAGLADAGSNYSFELNRQGNHMVNQDGDKAKAWINDSAGKIYNVHGSYDEDAQTLSWSTTAGKGWESFWLVINSGGNPKSLAQEGKLGMIYFDRKQESLSVYQYTSRGGNSYQNGELIASSMIDDSFILDKGFEDHGNKRTGSFTLDVSSINTALGGDWMGLQFGEEIGIWMHLFDRRRPGAVYNQDGELKCWGFRKHGYLDTNAVSTTKTETVPTPSAALAGMAGLGLLASRRRNKEAA